MVGVGFGVFADGLSVIVSTSPGHASFAADVIRGEVRVRVRVRVRAVFWGRDNFLTSESLPSGITHYNP